MGFGLLAGMVAMGLAVFLMGLKIYRRQGPLGSPFTRFAQVFVAAARKWRAEEAGEGCGVCYDDEDEQGTAPEGCRNRALRLARTPQFGYVGFRFPFSWLEGGLSLASVERASACAIREGLEYVQCLNRMGKFLNQDEWG